MISACDHASNASLTQPSGSSSTPGLPSPQLTVRADSRGSSVAIVGVSEVTFDARGTPGDKLRYDIQFGDGQSVTTPTATHVYTTSGTFTATLAVTDSADRRSSASATVTVKAVTGTWFYSDYNEGSRRAEAHRITIATQEGRTLRGIYATVGAEDRAMTGALSGERDLQLAVADGSVEFRGTVPSEVAVDWSLSVRGGRIDGQTRPFRRVVDEPTGPSPTAQLRVRLDPEYAFGDAAIMGVTPITFDVSQSVGESLSYVIEFGDGDFTQMSSSSATHASMREGSLTAAVTVTDRFGRFAVASQHFGPVERLGVQRYNYDPAWHNSIWNAAANRFEIRSLRIGTHDGLTLSGSVPSSRRLVVAVLSHPRRSRRDRTHPDRRRSHAQGTSASLHRVPCTTPVSNSPHRAVPQTG